MMVQVEVEKLDNGQVALNVQVDRERVQQAIGERFREYAKRIKVPGFRQGHVPREILEREIDREALRHDVLDDLVAEAYDEAVKQAGIDVLGRGEVSETAYQEDESLHFKAVVATKPEVKLGEYLGLAVTRPSTEVTDAQVDTEIEKLRERRGQMQDVTDRGIETGDVAVVDYQVSVDGQVREEAGATGYPLVVGSDTLFPELNEALLGAKADETRHVPVSYPDDFSVADLAGKQGEVEVTVRRVQAPALPVVDDAFVQSISDLKSVEELRAEVRRQLAVMSEVIAARRVRDAVVHLAVEGSYVEPPATLVSQELEHRLETYKSEVAERGWTWAGYLNKVNRTEDQVREELQLEARAAVKQVFIIEAIGEKENVEVTREDIDAEIATIAETEKVSVARVTKMLGEGDALTRLINRVYRRKVVDLLVAAAQITPETTAPDADPPSAEPGEK
jgi:trigger factor